MAFIYVIINDVNGKRYVGKTNNSIDKRFKEHIKDSKRERYEKRPLYSAMNKYGIEHFHIEELEECSAEESAEREEYWITKLDTYGHNGYNATRGGDSKKYYDYKEIADKYLELQNQQETAKYFDCDVHTVRVACQEYNISILSSVQASKKINSKKVCMRNQDGEILQIFDSMSDAGRFLQAEGITMSQIKHISSNIGQAASHSGRLSAYGYKWSFC